MNRYLLLGELGKAGVFVELKGIELRVVSLGGALTDELSLRIEHDQPVIYRCFLDEMREANIGGLAPDRARWPEDAREAFEERAAIIEFDAGKDRETAELMAEISVRLYWADRRELGS